MEGPHTTRSGQEQPDDRTLVMPRVDATVLLPQVIMPREPEHPPSLRELADSHGLAPAGTRPTLAEYTRDLWRFRHFALEYANARLAASYSNARLGRLWQVLTPLTNAAVYYLIFGVVLSTRDNVPNFVGYLCTGLFVFTFTQTVTLGGVQSISGRLGLVRALQFPRACLPIAVTLTQVQSAITSFVVLMGIVVVTGDPITLKWLLLLPAVLLQSVFNLGLALAIARLGAKLTDIKQLMPYLMRTWMYASGVFYSVEVFDEHLPDAAATVLRANPLLVYVELARYALLESPPLASPPLQLWLLGVGWALLAFVAGYVYFWHGEPEYGRG